MPTQKPPIRIGFLLCERMLATSSTLPMEMLLAAESAMGGLLPQEAQQPLAIHTLSYNGEAVSTRTGLNWQAGTDLDNCEPWNLIYLPGLWRNPRPVIKAMPRLLPWLQEQHQNGAIISAVGTGVCFLAEAGLLNDKAATTHWHYFDQFHRDYPQVHLKRQHFITQAGNLYCAASINSLADLTVHFIQRFLGKAVASHVERHFSHEIRRAYDSSGFFEKEHNPHPDEEILQVQMWLQHNYPRNIQLPQLAERFGMSQRTLNRRFKHALGQSPIAFLQEVRINTARDLLKTSNLSLGEIADKVGYQNAGYFSQLFKKQLATSPNDYRKTVRGKLFRADY